MLAGPRLTGCVETFVIASNHKKREEMYNHYGKGNVPRKNIVNAKPITKRLIDPQDGLPVNTSEKEVASMAFLIDSYLAPGREFVDATLGAGGMFEGALRMGISSYGCDSVEYQYDHAQKRINKVLSDATNPKCLSSWAMKEFIPRFRPEVYSMIENTDAAVQNVRQQRPIDEGAVRTPTKDPKNKGSHKNTVLEIEDKPARQASRPIAPAKKMLAKKAADARKGSNVKTSAKTMEVDLGALLDDDEAVKQDEVIASQAAMGCAPVEEEVADDSEAIENAETQPQAVEADDDETVADSFLDM